MRLAPFGLTNRPVSQPLATGPFFQVWLADRFARACQPLYFWGMTREKKKQTTPWLKPNRHENRATTFSNDPAREREPLIGLEAETVTNLHPTGAIRVQGRSFDAVAEGTFIGAGEKVRITGSRDFRLRVEKAT